MSVIKPMVEKCLGQAKATLKQKSQECMLMLFEVSESFDEDTMDAILAFVKSKKPKVSLTFL